MPQKVIVGDRSAQAERRAAREERAKIQEAILELNGVTNAMSALILALDKTTFDALANNNQKFEALRKAAVDIARDLRKTANQTKSALRILKED